MIGFFLSAAMLSAAPEPCAVPESMPAPSEQFEGAGDADWCLAGADIFSLAGPDARPLQQVSIEMPIAGQSDSVFQITQWRRGAPEVPAGWRAIQSDPGLEVAQTAFHEILYQRFGGHMIVVTINPAWRIGNAICTGEGGPSTAYLPAGVTPTQDDHAVLAGFEDAWQQRDMGNIMCTLMTRDADGYTMRFRGPQGRPLPEIDGFYAEARVRLTPTGNIEALLGVSR